MPPPRTTSDKPAATEPPVPYEHRADAWLRTKQPFQGFLQLSLPLAERERWMRHPELSHLTVFSCGRYVAALGHRWERRGLDEAVLIYCVAGLGHFEHRRRAWRIQPGDLLYCFPRTHHIYFADKDQPWSIYWMHLGGPRLALHERGLGVSPTAPVVHLGLRTEIIQRFDHLYSIFPFRFDERHTLAVQTCSDDLLATAAILPRGLASGQGNLAHIQDVSEYMRMHVDENLRLDHFARRFGTSTFHFSRLFKAATGRSPMEYFNHLKLRRACQLLVEKGLKVKDVATQLSFNDAGYFSRFFRQNMGMSPDQYRTMALEQSGAPSAAHEHDLPAP
jgi:AraC-like DNA-binding protein